MSSSEPLPFRIGVPGKDVIEFSGIRKVSYRIEGQLQLIHETLILEWTATEKTEQVAFSGISTLVEESPIGRREIPVDSLAEARLRGGWWWPQLVLRGRGLDVFEDMPGRKGGTLFLRIGRRFRQHAKALVTAIELAREAAPLPPAEPLTELDAGNVPQLDDGGGD
jgi:hypothetical protein